MKLKWFYKGIRVRECYRELVPKIAGGVILLPLIACLLLTGWNISFRYEISGLLKAVGVGGICSIVLAFLLLKMGIWHHIYYIQKLCRMNFDAVYYNLEGEEIDGMIVNSRKDMTYFPKMYYRYKHGQMKIAIKLDGSRYHEKFMEMGDQLAEMFDMEVIRAKQKYWYMVYVLEDIEESRLYVEKGRKSASKGKIELMKGLFWTFDSAPHALITGITGGGKTWFLQYIINSLKSMGAVVKIIDPKRSDLYRLRHILGEEQVAYAVGKVMQMFRELMQEMDKRYEALDSASFGADYKTIGLPPIFLVFDEFIAFSESIDKPEDAKKLMSYLTRIVLEGRQAGIQLIFATQRADAKYLTGSIRDNLGLRVSLGALEKSGYRMTFGDVDRKFRKFGAGHGYIWIDGTTDTVREFYSPHFGVSYDPVEHLREIVGRKAASPCELRSSSSGSVMKGEAAFLQSEDGGRA